MLLVFLFCSLSPNTSLLRTIPNPLYLSTAVDSGETAAVTWIEGVGVKAVDYMYGSPLHATSIAMSL